ncbi:MAG: hypothetical protein ACOY90_05695 [Candidatus Zhuqueibacterota bacterium]
MKNDAEVTLLVNGEKVKLNPFVHSVFINVVGALVSSLKLNEDAEKIELTVTAARE